MLAVLIYYNISYHYDPTEVKIPASDSVLPWTLGPAIPQKISITKWLHSCIIYSAVTYSFPSGQRKTKCFGMLFFRCTLYFRKNSASSRNSLIYSRIYSNLSHYYWEKENDIWLLKAGFAVIRCFWDPLDQKYYLAFSDVISFLRKIILFTRN